MDTLTEHRKNWLSRGVHFIYLKWIRPRSLDEDRFRREFILNVLLTISILLCFVLTLLLVQRAIVSGGDFGGEAPHVMVFITLFFLGLLWLSHRGYSRLAAILFLFLYYISIAQGMWEWGADLPIGLLAFALLIIMSSILVSTMFSFSVTALVTATIIGIAAAQEMGIAQVISIWKSRSASVEDAIVAGLAMLVIALISWLSNREIEKSLRRARISEADLRTERDSLEIKVEERTQELKRLQLEKLSQLYRFVEFGRYASGFFHDVASPLNAVRLNLEQVKLDPAPELANVQHSVERAFRATQTVESFLKAVRKQIQHHDTVARFSVVEEIRQVIQILDYKAKVAQVELHLHATDKEIELEGDAILFHQIMTNLISNAIDSYDGVPRDKRTRTVTIDVTHTPNGVRCYVVDFGSGIPEASQQKIFEPFFSTKSADKGMGLGLSITKNSIEKDFHGSIQLKTGLGVGTTFIVDLPHLSSYGPSNPSNPPDPTASEPAA